MSPPFTCTYSPNLPELLRHLNCSIAISAFQAGKVILLSAKNDEELTHLPRNFAKPMGIALQGQKMAVACLNDVVVLANSPQLAADYPKKPNTYDALYLPRASHHTGGVDIHDLEFGENGELFAVVTAFSCIAKIDDGYSFTPVWQPKFITRLAHEDRCHLNGVALQNGKPVYATALSSTDHAQGWRDALPNNGILMDIESNEIIAGNLPMPHSPLLLGSELFLLLSATGELVKMDVQTGKHELVVRLNGFVRGLCQQGEFVFIGLSRLRKTSSIVAKLDFVDKENMAGVAVVHLPTGELVGEVHYHTSVDEIYDVVVLPDCQRPGILNTENPIHKTGITTPGLAVWK